MVDAEIIEESKANTKKVGLGTTVTIRFLEDNSEKSFMIVATVETNPFAGRISNSCPLGKALVGRGVGEIVEVKAARNYKVEILKIEIK